MTNTTGGETAWIEEGSYPGAHCAVPGCSLPAAVSLLFSYTPSRDSSEGPPSRHDVVFYCAGHRWEAEARRDRQAQRRGGE